MNPQIPREKSDRWFEIFFVFAAFLQSYYFADLRLVLCNANSIISFRDLVDGVSFTPFQYRILAPLAIRYLSDIMAIPPEAAFQCLETLVGLSIMLLTAYYLNLFISSQKYCAIFSLLSFTLLSFNLLLPRYSLFPYDLSAILFFLVCLICMKKRRWVLYFLFFAIGTYNRETTCFLAFVYLFTSMGRDSRKKLIVFCFLQLAIWVLVKAHLFYVYRENPQLGVFYLNCQTNLRMFLEPHKLILLLSNFGFVVLPTIYFHRSIESDFVKKSLLVAIPYLLGMSLVGVLAEIRIFVELFPIVISAYAMIVLKMARENGVDAERRR